MIQYLLDANVIIALLTGRHFPLEEKIRAHEADAIAVSSIVTFELYYGAFSSARLDRNLAAIDGMRFSVVPFDQDDARRAGAVRADLKARGTPIGAFDTLIAGQALGRNLTLVTNNVREFRRVPGLSVEDWLDG